MFTYLVANRSINVVFLVELKFEAVLDMNYPDCFGPDSSLSGCRDTWFELLIGVRIFISIFYVLWNFI
jgi:hypothetical protein